MPSPIISGTPGDPGDGAGSSVSEATLTKLQDAVDKAQAALDSAQALLDTATDDYDAAHTAYESAKSLDTTSAKIAASASTAAKAAAAKFMVAMHQTHSDEASTTLGAVLSGGPSDDLLQRLTAANQLGSMNGSLNKLAARAMSTAKQASSAKAAAAKAHAALEAIPLDQKSAAMDAAQALVDAAQATLDSATQAMTDASSSIDLSSGNDLFSGGDFGTSFDPGPDNGGGGFAPNTSQVNAMIAFAEAQLGEPYVFGGAGPTTWDCSGLTMMAYRAAGIDIGQHAVISQVETMKQEGRLLPYSDRERGDLIFWSSGDGSFPHVAIYLGHDMILAAPQEGETVTIEPVWTSAGEQLYGLVGRPSGTP
ncbi:hypothetical protein GCM10027568_09140 [Humibacter soli]